MFTDRAQNLAVVNDLYGPLDSIWGGYEVSLPRAIQQLVSGEEVELDLFLRVLVPFVAAFFLRGPDFDARMTARIRALGVDPRPGNSNAVRPMELRRLLTPVIACRWMVVSRRPSADRLVVSDIGWVPFREPESGEVGAAIPLNADAVLQLVFQREKTVSRWNGTTWVANIERRTLADGAAEAFNFLQADYSIRHVFAATERAARKVAPRLQSEQKRPPLEPGVFAPMSGSPARAHENLWFALASNAGRPPHDPLLAKFDAGWDSVGSGWHPPVIPYRVTDEEKRALSIAGDAIRLTLVAVTDAHLAAARRDAEVAFGASVSPFPAR